MEATRESVAVFGGGCFWCTEAVFKKLKGVSKVLPGYAGGSTENPTYKEVSSGTTGHAEVISIAFDKLVVSYKTLLTIFFASHDSTTPNRQGADVGTQYRSVIFYTNEDQKKEAEDFIAKLNAEEGGETIVTEVVPLTKFFEAEDYHHDYYEQNKGAPYCQLVINPKLEKVQAEFAGLLKSI